MVASYLAMMKHIYCALVSVLLTLLSSNGAYGANSLPWHMSRMTGIGPPKRWLVFMEVRINWCVRMTSQSGGVRGDIVTLIECLSRRQNLPERCHRVKIRSTGKNSASFYTTDTFLFMSPLPNVNFQKHCTKLNAHFYNITVHKLFGVNLTITEFYVFDYHGLQPFHDNCTRSKAIFTIKGNSNTYDYCGKRYPWSIYSHSNTVSIELRPVEDTQSIVSIHMEIGAVDYGFVETLKESYVINMYIWSDFTVQTYHISVEKLFQVKVLTGQESQQQYVYTIFDGPQSEMPVLIPGRSIMDHGVYISSTFQIYVVCASIKAISKLDLNYTINGYSNIHVLPVQQEIIVTNNTGCGDNSINSWMCTLRLLSAEGTHIQLKLSSLEAIGEFSGIIGFAGFAVYNFVNDTRILVAHWYNSMALAQINLSVTSTENQLCISVYAYAPFTLLSCRFKAELTPCRGRFIGKYIRPSISVLPHFITMMNIEKYPITRPAIYIYFNISVQCVAIQIILLPDEYILIEPFTFLYFGHDSVLKITKSYLPNGQFASVREWVDGDYHSVKTHYDLTGMNIRFFEIIGFIKYISEKIIWPSGNKAVTLMEVEQAPCVQPCLSINIFILSIDYNNSMCDICKYQWLAKTPSQTWYRTSAYAILELESVHGDHVFDIRLSSGASMNCGGHVIDYSLGKIALHFYDTRAVFPTVKTGQLLRFKRSYLVKDRYELILTCPYCAEQTKILRRGVYEYIIYMPELCGVNWEHANEYCLKHGAYLLHTFDKQELHFVINKIMLPNKLELAFIGMKRVVSSPVTEIK